MVETGKGRQVVVTGGAGFIGSHVVDALVADGWRVTVVDDLSGGRRENLPEEIAAFAQCDIASDDFAAVFDAARYDAVVHCAAQTSVPRSVAEPEHDRRVNLVGTENVLRQARRAGIRRVVFFSSGGAIYGDTATRADETTPPAPLSPYGAHKLAAESSVARSGLSYAILRPANVYGPRQRVGTDGGVVATFVDRLRQHVPLHINGDGTQVRDFVYVTDVAAAVRSALSWDASGIWNIASGVDTTISALARHVGEAMGVVPRIEYGPMRPGDVRVSRLSNARLTHGGLWRPDYTLAQGLRATVAGRGREREPSCSLSISSPSPSP